MTGTCLLACASNKHRPKICVVVCDVHWSFRLLAPFVGWTVGCKTRKCLRKLSLLPSTAVQWGHGISILASLECIVRMCRRKLSAEPKGTEHSGHLCCSVINLGLGPGFFRGCLEPGLGPGFFFKAPDLENTELPPPRPVGVFHELCRETRREAAGRKAAETL